MSNPDLPRDELAAVLEARRELGKEYEPALVESFIERLNRVVDARVQAGLAERARSDVNRAESVRGQVQLGIGSLALGILEPTAVANNSASVHLGPTDPTGVVGSSMKTDRCPLWR